MRGFSLRWHIQLGGSENRWGNRGESRGNRGRTEGEPRAREREREGAQEGAEEVEVGAAGVVVVAGEGRSAEQGYGGGRRGGRGHRRRRGDSGSAHLQLLQLPLSCGGP